MSRKLFLILSATIIAILPIMIMALNPGAQAEASALSVPVNKAVSASASLSSPVRGVPGDWWADVVVGQPNFGQITPNEVVGNKLFNPGGVYVDRSAIPNRLYVYDAGNSRILGFSSLGACTAGSKIGQSCTSNSDCPGSACTIDSHKPADIILGQQSAHESTCNGDSGFQTYPDLPAPNASTLCGLRPESISILEGGSAATMASDPQGNLYHPDYFNNRILRYNNPFTNDSTADFVWGQSDFVHAGCNEGRSYGQPDNKSLCLAAPLTDGSVKSGVAIDPNLNLWVTDTQNNRLLRFPYNPALGAPGHVADLVFGQSVFTTAGSGNGLNQMNHPASVRVGPDGKVYVLDGIDGWGTNGRLLVFTPPFSNGMAASQAFSGWGDPTGLELDPDGSLWVNNGEYGRVLHLVNGQLQIAIPNVSGLLGGLGIDRDRNIILTGWDAQAVNIYSAPSFGSTTTFLQPDDYGFANQLGPRGLFDPGGLEVTDDQLIVSDQTRLLFWNNPTQLTNNYPAADGVVGQPDLVTRPRWGQRYGRMRADTLGRLWILRGDGGNSTHILAYQLPLQSQAEPMIEIPSPIPLKGGGSLGWSESLGLGGIAYQPNCDCLWVSDTNYSRVFRINQVSSPNRFVDIVLGQTSIDGSHCNQGRDSDDGYVRPKFPSQGSLCHPGGLAFDRNGNLFVSDHNLENAGNLRLLEYNAAGLPPSPAAPIFALPASQVYGRNGSFTEPNCQAGDPMCGPWEPVFYPNNDMVIGFNTYLGTAFPQVYHDPLTNPLPYTAVRDFYSHAYSARLDSLNNLYILDLTRDHVLIYKAARYTISGNVGVAGVTLSYVDGTSKSVLSSSHGDYSFSVSSGWSGAVTPSHPCLTFTPGSRNYVNVTANQTAQDYTFAVNNASGCADVHVLIGGTDRGRFILPAHSSTRASFAELNSGPVKVASSNSVPLIEAERVIYKVNGVNTSFTEMMGLPDQLSNTYWLPWYNNVDLDTQLRFGNVGGSSATVRVYIGGHEMTSGCSPSNSPYNLPAGASLRVSCAGVNDGPVKIQSTQNIVAAERVIYKVNNLNTSFTEMMALPNSQLNTTYWLPWYNNVDLDTQLRFGNVSSNQAQVHVFIGGTEMTGSPFTLQIGESKRISFTGINSGPVKIESNQNIVAAERVIYKVNNLNTSFTEMMALPNSQLNTINWLPWYNNVDLDTQLRFGNVSSNPTQVHVFIGGLEMTGSPFTLQIGESKRISFVGVNNGPVKIQSDYGVPVVAAERVIYKVNNINTSFSEMMALPHSQLNATYWLPWYNNVDLDTQLRFGVP